MWAHTSMLYLSLSHPRTRSQAFSANGATKRLITILLDGLQGKCEQKPERKREWERERENIKYLTTPPTTLNRNNSNNNNWQRYSSATSRFSPEINDALTLLSMDTIWCCCSSSTTNATEKIVSHKKRILEIENISKSVHKMGKTDVCVCVYVYRWHSCFMHKHSTNSTQYMHASMQTAATIPLA